MVTRRLSWLVGGLLMAMSVLGITGNLVLAASDTPANVKITLTAREIKPAGGARTISISARLTDTDQPMGGQSVDFYVATSFFGQDRVKIGNVKTDGTGAATIYYEPRWEGMHVFTATLDSQNTVETTISIPVSGPVGKYTPEPVALLAVQHWASTVVGMGVLAVWAVLLFVGIRTLRGIARASTEPKVRRYYPVAGKRLSDSVQQHQSAVTRQSNNFN